MTTNADRQLDLDPSESRPIPEPFRYPDGRDPFDRLPWGASAENRTEILEAAQEISVRTVRRFETVLEHLIDLLGAVQRP